MAPLLWLLLLPQSAQSDCPAATQNPTRPISLVVQVVNHDWLPLPGAKIVVRNETHTEKPLYQETANQRGFACFELPEPPDSTEFYSVESRLPLFKDDRIKGVPITANSIRYVQLKLKLR
jgi:hypothetical protein